MLRCEGPWPGWHLTCGSFQETGAVPEEPRQLQRSRAGELHLVPGLHRPGAQGAGAPARGEGQAGNRSPSRSARAQVSPAPHPLSHASQVGDGLAQPPVLVDAPELRLKLLCLVSCGLVSTERRWARPLHEESAAGAQQPRSGGTGGPGAVRGQAAAVGSAGAAQPPSQPPWPLWAQEGAALLGSGCGRPGGRHRDLGRGGVSVTPRT